MSTQSSVATLELLLPNGKRKDVKTKNYVETRLDVLGQELMNRIVKEHNLKYINLIFRGKILSPGKRLDEQGVKNRNKIMVAEVTDNELIQQMHKEEEEKRNMEEEEHKRKKKQDDRVKRTQRGLHILHDRDGSKNPWAPYLEITDQWGNSLKIPDEQRKALILAMGFHEKGRSLLKRKEYDNAVCHLLKADEEFRKCDPGLQKAVDNYAVLQLDIVWCHQALEALSCLDDARSRLEKAESCFKDCYGEEQERLRTIKGDRGKEQVQVLFLRLYLLQSLLFHLDENNREAQDKLSEVEALYSRLRPDLHKIKQLMDDGFTDGFTEREARLALRACQGNQQAAVGHITQCRKMQEQVKERERDKRRKMRQAACYHTKPASGVWHPLFTSSEDPSTSQEDDELVSEVLMDISRHEEDYLDQTLEEEDELINKMKTYLSNK